MSEHNDTELAGKATRKDYVTESVFMLCAVVPVMVSAYVSIKTGEGHWFQRSGALMVLFSIAVESHRSRMRARGIDTSGAGSRRRPGANTLVARFWSSIPYICYLAIVVGTLIWSYGDLLFA